MAVLDFWFEFASTYSYPAAMRVEQVAAAAGVTVRWRPFLLAPIFGSQGWNDSPFNIYPVKGKYMWRDLERICAREGLPPLRFPQNGLKAARLALIGERGGWGPAFVRAGYTANFAEQKDIADDAVLAAILRGLGVDPDAAIARELFGAPSFTVGEELFWGNDRLEEAVAWAVKP